MTFDANVPNGGQSPGLFPTQANTNFARLKTLINAEHVFNDTAGVTDGVHKQMTTINRSDPVSLPAGTNFMFYSATNVPKTYDGVRNYFLPQIVASVSFKPNGLSPVTISNMINISGVTRVSTGIYTIGFTTALPDVNGPFQFSIQSDNDISTPLFVFGSIIAFTTSSMTIRTIGLSGTVADVYALSLQVYKG